MHLLSCIAWSCFVFNLGYNSVLAKGRSSPSSAHDTVVHLDKLAVAVSQCKPSQALTIPSSFDQDEFLVYHESQQRLRYILTFKF
jgi:hypothetical protein